MAAQLIRRVLHHKAARMVVPQIRRPVVLHLALLRQVDMAVQRTHKVRMAVQRTHRVALADRPEHRVRAPLEADFPVLPGVRVARWAVRVRQRGRN